jgi:hypothetical protein
MFRVALEHPTYTCYPDIFKSSLLLSGVKSWLVGTP